MRRWLVDTALEEEARLKKVEGARTLKVANFQYQVSIMLWQLGHWDEGVKVANASLKTREPSDMSRHTERVI